jgi:hypothetical protein
MSASEKRYRRVAPVSKDGAAPWFETPRTRSANLGRPKIAAPHHEAGADHACIQLIGNRFRLLLHSICRAIRLLRRTDARVAPSYLVRMILQLCDACQSMPWLNSWTDIVQRDRGESLCHSTRAGPLRCRRSANDQHANGLTRPEGQVRFTTDKCASPPISALHHRMTSPALQGANLADAGHLHQWPRRLQVSARDRIC